ncbi:hypothetical protein BDW59DRAFT_181387 [Aspergillus cavernicola]|uniref:Uncharacterized protein n=1 Tax=Aspergillus cavernicola TaxID=176166 RepID=A0ABR4HZQ8_9EURO
MRHNARKDELKKVLDPMFSADGSNSVLVCWGKSSCCHITPIRVGDPDNEVPVWQELRQQWYSRRGKWRKYLPFYCVPEVDIIEVSIAGQDSIQFEGATPTAKFIGTYSFNDTFSEQKRLEKVIEDYQPQEFPCAYDSDTGYVNCSMNCITRLLDDAKCPERTRYKAERKLASLHKGPFLKLAFLDPNIATLNPLLNKEGVILRNWDILRTLDTWHCPDLRELRFPAVHIRDSWMYSQHTALSLILLLLFVLVVASRLLYGDWGTAYTAANFFVSLGALTQITWKSCLLNRLDFQG